MSQFTVYSRLGLIGKALKLEENVLLTISGGEVRDIKVGASEEEGKFQYSDAALVPGFINAHTHIGDSFAKDRGLEYSIKDLVAPPNGLKHQLLRRVSPEELILGFKNAFQEMIMSGTTTFVDFRESGVKGVDILMDALSEVSIKGIICGRPFPNLEDLPDVIRLCDCLGLSSTNNYSDADLNYMRGVCKSQDKLILTHVAETQESHLKAAKKYHLTDIIRAIKILDADILVHATWANDQDIQKIAEKKRGIVICPRSNSHLGVGFPPVNSFLKKNILTCLGTDNVMINNLNLFREMEFLFKMVKSRWNIGSISSYDILKMVTVNPAVLFKVDDEIGSIEAGKKANFFLLGLKSPNIQPFSSLYDSIVLRANPSNIMNVFIGGKKVYDRESKGDK